MSVRELENQIDEMDRGPDPSRRGIANAFGKILRDDIEGALDSAGRTGRLARAVNAAFDEYDRPRSVFSRRALRWAFAALALTGSSAVAAGLWPTRWRPSVSPVENLQATPRRMKPVIVAIPEPEPAADPAPVLAPPHAVPGSRPARGRGVPGDWKESPAALFSSGNEARRAGRYADAERIYERLQERYLDSPEANVSRVALGRLLLDRGRDLTRALRLFDEYIKLAPRGALTEQALAGRALALRKLGRHADEQRAWQRLREGFPDSPHADVGANDSAR